MSIPLMLILLVGAAESPLEKPGKKAEADTKKAVKQAGEAVQKAGKKLDKGVHDAADSLRKSLDKK
jgi:hypothetical protein